MEYGLICTTDRVKVICTQWIVLNEMIYLQEKINGMKLLG